MKAPFFRVTVEYMPDLESDPDAYRLHWQKEFESKSLRTAAADAAAYADAFVVDREKRARVMEKFQP